MKAEDLLRYIGGIDDRYVAELHTEDDCAVAKIERVSLRKRVTAIAASLAVIILGTCLMLGSGLGTGSGMTDARNGDLQIPMAKNTVIMIDVNPSLRLEIDDRDVVISAKALNDDAKELGLELNVCGKNYKDAVTEVMRVMHDNKYLSELKNSVLITVVDPSETVAESYRKAAVDAVNAFGETAKFGVSVISQLLTDAEEYEDEALEAHISAGRMALIDKICEKCGSTADKLIGYNVQVLNQVLEYVGIPADVERVGSVAGVIDEVTQGVLGLASMTADSVIELSYSLFDFLLGLCDYYDEADVASQNNYELHIKQSVSDTGKVSWSISATGNELGGYGESQESGYTKDYELDNAWDTQEQIQGLLGIFGTEISTNDDKTSAEITSSLPGVRIKIRVNQK